MNIETNVNLRLIHSKNQLEPPSPRIPEQVQEEEVFSKLLQAFENRLLSKRLKTTYIKSNLVTVREFFEYTNLYPWEWTPEDFDDWSAYIYTIRKNNEATQRRKQGIIDRFQHFLVTSPTLSDLCYKLFDKKPIEVCSDENKVLHKVSDENKELRTAFTVEELECLWKFFKDKINEAYEKKSKNLKVLQRDLVLYLTIYYFGLRIQEGSMLTTIDFIANPQKPEFGNMGGMIVRYGKASAGSPPKRRTVWAISKVPVNLLNWYITNVRPKFGYDETNFLFLSERNTRLTTNSITRNFKNYLQEAGLSGKKYSTHSLRHSYISHLSELQDISPRFIQGQVGHSFLATTQLYTHLTDGFINKQLNKIIEAQMTKYFDKGDN